MSWSPRIIHRLFLVRLLYVVAVLVFCGVIYLSHASGADLPQRSLQLSDSRASMTASYVLSFTIPASETLGSIQLLFCANSPLESDICNPPAGFDISSATLGAQSGETGFTILSSATDAHTLVLTRAPQITAGGIVSYTFTNVLNPSSTGGFYGRLRTFATTDATGPYTDFGGLAMSISTAIAVSTTVPPYLLLCSAITITGFDCSTASGNYINFGNLSPVSTASANTELVTATNAASGYAMQVYGTTMTSGNNIIPAIASADVSRPGTGQFGLNLVANTTPAMGANPQGPGASAPLPGYNQPNFFKFVSGDVVADTTAPDDFRKLTASYIVNMPVGQPVGVYVATLTYVCLANF